jgi:hypothetical protein
MTGIEYPTVTHDGRVLVVRPSNAAFVLMRRRGLAPDKAHLLMQAPKVRDEKGTVVDNPAGGNPNWVNDTYIYFSCCVAENFVDLSQPHRVSLDAAPTADYWAISLPDYGEVSKLCWTAMGKHTEEQRTKLAVVPPTAAAS